MSPVAGKRGLRELARATRLAAAAAAGSEAGERLRESFLSALPLPPAQVVAGYWPIDEEMDVRPLMTCLHLSGHVLVLPVVVTVKFVDDSTMEWTMVEYAGLTKMMEMTGVGRRK